MMNFSNVMKDKKRYLSKEEVDLMLQWCYSNNRIRDYVLISILWASGRRISEVIGQKPFRVHGLRPCDIHDNLIEWCILKKNHIRTKTKNGSVRSEDVLNKLRIKKEPLKVMLPIDKDTMSLLKLYIEENNISSSSRVFPITRPRVTVILKHICRKCLTRSPNDISPHVFRHSYAIHLFKSNPRNPSVLKKVQDLLQHSTVDMTMTYARFSQEDLQEVLDKSFA